MQKVVLKLGKDLYSIIHKRESMIWKKRCKIYLIEKNKIAVNIFYLLGGLFVDS